MFVLLLLYVLKLFYILQKHFFVSLTNNYGKDNILLIKAKPHRYPETRIFPVPFNVVVCQLMMYSNVIVCITISCGLLCSVSLVLRFLPVSPM